MTSELLAFSEDHIDLIDLRDGQDIRDYKDRIAVYATMGHAYTLVVDNKIICCSGIINSHQGVAEAWVIAGKDFEKHGMVISRTIKGFLDLVQPFYHRFQMSVLVGFEDAEKFAEFLGFEKEGIMRKFDSAGKDYTLYSRIKEIK